MVAAGERRVRLAVYLAVYFGSTTDIGAIPAAGLMTWIWAALAGIDTGARTSEWLLSLLVSLLMGAVFWGRDKVPTVTVISPSSSAIALFDHPSLLASSVQIAAIFALIAAVRLSTGHGNPPEFTDLAAWFLASQMVFAGQRTAMRYAKTHLNKTGILDEQIAIVGAGQQSDLLAELIDQSGYRGYHLFGVFDDRKSRLDGLRYPPRGDIDDLARMGRDAAIDRVIIALPYEAETRIIDLTQRLKSIAADIYLGLREPRHDDCRGAHQARQPRPGSVPAEAVRLQQPRHRDLQIPFDAA